MVEEVVVEEYDEELGPWNWAVTSDCILTSDSASITFSSVRGGNVPLLPVILALSIPRHKGIALTLTVVSELGFFGPNDKSSMATFFFLIIISTDNSKTRTPTTIHVGPVTSHGIGLLFSL